PVAQEVLKKQFNGIEIISDVRDIDRLENIDILCAGFPCQDLSSSGLKKGIGGNQSSLVDEIFRILEKSNIDYVVIENVKFMLHLNKGEAMKKITSEFERLGYNWAYRILDSQYFGVPQRRHRLFFVASRKNDPRNILLSDNIPIKKEKDIIDLRSEHVGFYWTEGMYSTGISKDSIPPLKTGSTIGIPSPPAILSPTGSVFTPNINDAERLQGFDVDWTLPSESVAKSSARWRLIGNSVTVPISKWIADKIQYPTEYDSTSDQLLGDKWTHAAWSISGKRYSSSSSYNAIDKRTKLSDFLAFEPKPLSLKAVNGFIQRAYKGNLKFPDGFLASLEKYATSLES
ncbi:DNA (cytosine-5-)-methyltransferase, partial [Salmonella enterica]|nr:DNA (cytosine-5-)-methyltransferase [Salmonella enterica]